MGFLDLLKGKSPSRNPLEGSGDLVFKSPREALEYAKQFMITHWELNHVTVGLLGRANFENCVLQAGVLLPRDDAFQELPTTTLIKAVSSPGSRERLTTRGSDIGMLGLKFGDLVSVYLTGRSDEMQELVPETEGWVGFVTAKNSLRYSMQHQGWITDLKYHL